MGVNTRRYWLISQRTTQIIIGVYWEAKNYPNFGALSAVEGQEKGLNVVLMMPLARMPLASANLLFRIIH